MTLEMLPWAIGIGLVALAIVVINDRIKAIGSPKKPRKRVPGSVLGTLLGIAVVGGVIGLCSVCGDEVRRLVWLVPLIAIAIYLLVVAIRLRKLIWACFRSVWTRQRPFVLVWTSDGLAKVKCPKCSAHMTLPEPTAEVTAFECPQCGLKGMWRTETSS